MHCYLSSFDKRPAQWHPNCEFCHSNVHSSDKHVCTCCYGTGHVEEIVCLYCDIPDGDCLSTTHIWHRRRYCVNKPMPPRCTYCRKIDCTPEQHKCTLCGELGHDELCYCKSCLVRVLNGKCSRKCRGGRKHVRFCQSIDFCPVRECALLHPGSQHRCKWCKKLGYHRECNPELIPVLEHLEAVTSLLRVLLDNIVIRYLYD